MSANIQTIEDFRKNLMDQAKISAISAGVGMTLPFIECVLSELKDTNFVDNPATFYWSGKGANNTEILIFGYDLDEADNSISLYTGTFQDTVEIATVTRGQIDEKATRALRFAKESLVPSKIFKNSVENEAADLCDFIQSYNRLANGISKFKIVFITNDKLSARVKRVEIDEIVSGIPAEVQVWDIERLHNLLVVSNKGREDIELDIKELTGKKIGIPYLEVPQDVDNNFSCYLTVLPGDLLAQIYHDYGSRLLEGNVRSFLSTKTAVNKKIQATINTEPAKFFVYNNGISATASGLEFDSGAITKISNIQIINGGQTTASLAYAKYKRNNDVSKISVQMKLTVVKEPDPIELSNTIQKIARSSNSQNKVSDADFFANHEFHILIEKMSLQTQAPPAAGYTVGTYWFYERAKGQYNQKKMFMKSADVKKFEFSHPKDKLISKTDFAKYHNIWQRKPQTVSKGSITNFNSFASVIEDDWESENKRAKYNDLYFKKMCCIALLYRKLEKEITVHKQEWYNGSYRANVITYALALFFETIERNHKGLDFNYTRLWNDQEVSEELTNVLVELSKDVYQELTSLDREVENVTQWCKRDNCWKNIQQKFGKYQLDLKRINAYLVGGEQAISTELSAKKLQKMDNEIDLLSQVASPDKAFKWKNLPQFINQHLQVISPSDEELQAVNSVIKMCAGRGPNPPSYVLRTALNVWKRAVDNGWK